MNLNSSDMSIPSVLIFIHPCPGALSGEYAVEIHFVPSSACIAQLSSPASHRFYFGTSRIALYLPRARTQIGFHCVVGALRCFRFGGPCWDCSYTSSSNAPSASAASDIVILNCYCSWYVPLPMGPAGRVLDEKPPMSISTSWCNELVVIEVS